MHFHLLNFMYYASAEPKQLYDLLQVSSGVLTRTIQSAGVAASVEEGGHERALEVRIIP